MRTPDLHDLYGNAFRERYEHYEALAEGIAVQVVQIRRIAGGEQGPVTVFAHAFDQQIRHPVGGVHVVGAAAFIAGVLAQLQELLNVQVPAFQVGTRSEERRVGKECRSRWSTYHQKEYMQ